jgi:hypothetical protein
MEKQTASCAQTQSKEYCGKTDSELCTDPEQGILWKNRQRAVHRPTARNIVEKQATSCALTQSKEYCGKQTASCAQTHSKEYCGKIGKSCALTHSKEYCAETDSELCTDYI